jgi:hypothetical protein
MGSMSRQNIDTRKGCIYVKNQQQTKVAFQVNHQKFDEQNGKLIHFEPLFVGYLICAKM